MIIRLFCPKCAHEVAKKLTDHAAIDVPVPVTRIANDGEYEVICGKGHKGIVILDNLKFELLYEMGLNALIDGYPREAVSSFVASLERFYEFYWRVVMNYFEVSNVDSKATWKPLSKQSERQLGAYVSASLLLTKRVPTLLNQNKEVPFRNNVIHNGYVPTKEEAISFGNSVMNLINTELDNLRERATDALECTYRHLSPQSEIEDDENDDEVRGRVNILTMIDVRHPPKENDKRFGKVEDQFQRIIDERQPYRMELLTDDEMKKRYPEQHADGITTK